MTQHDESAFELLVWRHGPMILGVCRRVLRDEHQAEDAFQATLLALARKAASIGKRESVGSWLYKVAYRVALRARDGALRRGRHERQVPDLPPVADPHSPTNPAWAELRPLLDEELNRLSEKYRAPVVLCYLEGLTNEEAARQLGCPVGTVKTRLAYARRLLCNQLTRRGLTLGAGWLAAELWPPVAAAALPAALVGATVRMAVLSAMGTMTAAGAASAQVVSLTEGVLRAMMVMKMKQTIMGLLIGLALVGVGTASYQALAGEPAIQERAARDVPPAKASPAEIRVSQIKKQISELSADLRKAEEAAAREKALSPRQTPVAVIFGDVPITRDELADHLLSRMTAKQLETYVNRRILEHACKKEGITVTQAEVDDFLKTSLEKMSLNEDAFRAQLRDRHTTLQGWKEDVIHPQLLLQKLTATARVQEKEIRNAYEARYGEKAECQVILIPRDQHKAGERAASRLRTGETTFEQEAKRWPQSGISQPIVIARHATGSAAMETAALALRPGDVSKAIEVPNNFIILKCLRRIPADTATRFEDVRDTLKGDIQERNRAQDTTKIFQDLKAKARAKLWWVPAEEKGERRR